MLSNQDYLNLCSESTDPWKLVTTLNPNPAQPSTPPSESTINEFLNYIAPKQPVTLRQTTMGMGVFTSRPIAKGDVILRVPGDKFIKPIEYGLPSDQLNLAITLVNSQDTPYTRVLPVPVLECCLDKQTLLLKYKNTSFIHYLHKQLLNLVRQYTLVRRSRHVEWSEFKRVMGLVSTRQNSNGKGVCMIPLLDFCNWAPTGLKPSFEEGNALLYAERDMQEGEQVFIEYARTKARDQLAYWGFLQEGACDDGLLLRIDQKLFELSVGVAKNDSVWVYLSKTRNDAEVVEWIKSRVRILKIALERDGVDGIREIEMRVLERISERLNLFVKN